VIEDALPEDDRDLFGEHNPGKDDDVLSTEGKRGALCSLPSLRRSFVA
jgi:hypothetical protein